MEFTITIDWGMLVLGLVALAGGGVGYNVWVARLERDGSQHGYVALLVVLGVAGTGLVYGLVLWSAWAVGILALCFLASGIPMIAGSLARFNRARVHENQRRRHAIDEVLGE